MELEDVVLAVNNDVGREPVLIRSLTVRGDIMTEAEKGGKCVPRVSRDAHWKQRAKGQREQVKFLVDVSITASEIAGLLG